MNAILIPRPRQLISPGLLRYSENLGRCVKEARPSVLVIFSLRFAAGAALAAPATLDSMDIGRVLVSALVWVAAIFFTYLINGVMDVREDRINGSGRPIARGTLRRGFAARVCAATALLSLVGGCLLGARMAAAVATVLLIGWLYSGPPAYFKRSTIGTGAAGAALGLLSYVAGLVAWVRPEPDLTLPLFAAALSLWMAIVGAPAKDLSDVPGDAAVGRRTLAVVWGETTVRRLVAVTAVLLAAGLSAAAWTVAPALWWADAALTAGAACVVVVSLTRLSQGDRARRRRPYRAFMVTQYMAHICLLVSMLR